jgi:uncharacterized protein involved in outer membrane biogenesis
MSTRKKVILGILIWLLLILVALVVIVPLLFDVNRYRAQAELLIEKQTGKPAEIGHLALTFFPSLSIRVDDFALKNPSGFPQGYFVKAQRIYAVIDAGGLWDRQVVIKSLDLDTPAINLLSDLKGNWNFQSEPSPAKADPDPPGQKPLFTLAAISNVKITKGKLSVANLLPSGGSGPVFIEAEGVSSQLRQVDLNAFTESASVRSTAVPADHAAVSSRMLENPSSLSFRGAEGDEESRMSIVSRARFLPFAPLWVGMTTVTKVFQHPAKSGWLTSVAYAADPSGKLVAEGMLNMDSLRVMNLVVTNVKSKLRLFPKQVFLDSLDYRCYDGHAAGNLSYSSAGQNPHYNTDTKLDGVNMAKLLDAFPDARGKMTGTLDGTVKLDGEVSQSPDPLAGIRGSGQMNIRNGKLPGLQLDQNLLELAQLAKMGPASGDPGSFSSIAIDFTIANNRINTTKATIVGNGVEVDGSGRLALAGEGRLDYQGVVKVAASQNALTTILGGLSGATVANGKMAFPFNLTGTLQNPKFKLDTRRMNR